MGAADFTRENICQKRQSNHHLLAAILGNWIILAALLAVIRIGDSRIL